MRVDRLEELRQYIRQNKTVSITDITDHFHISMSTVRRDLSALLEEREFKKVYGGICVDNMRAVPIEERMSTLSEEKHMIGALAANQASDGDVVFLDAGSTIPYIVEGLAQKQDITIVTNSLPVLNYAAGHPSLRVIVLGGNLNDRLFSFVSYPVDRRLDRINIDVAFMSATGVSLRSGLSIYEYDAISVKEVVIKRGAKIVLLADHSKFGVSATWSYAALDKLTCVVTDRQPPEEFLEEFAKNGTQVIYPKP